ncbi:hypothetical protein Avbf_11856 [Armadillidium vulgare]|nr:hypothetical protein Avbf_11856 [Armadillidium vulgare]
MAEASAAATSSILDSLEETILSDMGIAGIQHLRGKKEKPTTILCNLFHWVFLLKESPCCVLNISHLSWTREGEKEYLHAIFPCSSSIL